MDVLNDLTRCNYYYYLLKRNTAYRIFDYLRLTADFDCIGDAFIRKIKLYDVKLPYYTDLLQQYKELYGKKYRVLATRIAKNNIEDNNKLFTTQIINSIRYKHLLIIQKLFSVFTTNTKLDINRILHYRDKVAYYVLNYIIQYYPNMFNNHRFIRKHALFTYTFYNLKLAMANSSILAITADDLSRYIYNYITYKMGKINSRVTDNRIDVVDFVEFIDHMQYLITTYNLDITAILTNMILTDNIYFFKFLIHKYPELKQYYINNRSEIFNVVLENGADDILDYIIEDGIYFPYNNILNVMQRYLNETVDNSDTTLEFMDTAVKYGINPFNNQNNDQNALDNAIRNSNVYYLKYIAENFTYIVFRNTIILGVIEDSYFFLNRELFDNFTNDDTKAFNILNLILAVVNNNFTMVKYLVEHGVDVTGLNNTALVQAVFYFEQDNHHESAWTMKYLIEHGADAKVLNQKYDGEWLVEKLLKHPYYNQDSDAGLNNTFIKYLNDKGLDISFLSMSEKRRYDLL